MLNFITGLWNRPSIRNRRFERVLVETRAELFFTERRYAINGMLIELSTGGALFREASKYILDRKRASVILRVGTEEFPGVIVNVRPVGYGILFDSHISDDTIAQIAAARTYAMT